MRAGTNQLCALPRLIEFFSLLQEKHGEMSNHNHYINLGIKEVDITFELKPRPWLSAVFYLHLNISHGIDWFFFRQLA